MAGTILAALSATHQADNTVVTAANSNLTSVSIGSGDTFVHLDASKMAGSEGYQLTQPGANQVFGYFDLASAVAKMPVRMEFYYPATPTATATILRAYPDTGHATVLWGVALTTANRLQFIETSPGTLNVTSAAGTPLVPGNKYYLELLVDATAATMTLNVYNIGSATVFTSITGTLTNPVAAQSVRVGIGTASALTQLNLNSNFAIGSGALLARSDIAVTAPTVALSPATGPVPRADGTNGTTVTATVNGQSYVAPYAIKVEYCATSDFASGVSTYLDTTGTYQASPTFTFAPPTVGYYRTTPYATQA